MGNKIPIVLKPIGVIRYWLIEKFDPVIIPKGNGGLK